MKANSENSDPRTDLPPPIEAGDLVPPAAIQWVVYLLECVDGSLYAGMTNRLQHRLQQHLAGKASRYTRARLPVKLVYSEVVADRSAALRREAAIKRLSRPQKLALLARMEPESLAARPA
ncbi:GIY-YIG nuclease family protein [Tuwongella immobilis]|uniref:GIY-YIG domain-containing protein n=1 Tax=Tuwongella immobilis TaxID=692036 RepID=A0A6C2YPW8_9BACT|nr:GIY-YIG nuclease family protein [Tuwongella immobilis]VIP02932.1 GIY-YIG nuclease family protein OS=Oscillibacter sp. KLE 1745 GN=HMPREF1546_02092 PE=4 SV=1: GIY-YIG [Tuwongella immobilis]VTS02884.1 GIY-YIG nuclease family protein OS=Oscillibacter sp. KLE 1745 GN=HMPREF1546_02092 PE=4 SV=1: GIY-YIG [Tuwongella immobilis]